MRRRHHYPEIPGLIEIKHEYDFRLKLLELGKTIFTFERRVWETKLRTKKHYRKLQIFI
jgi:hypothetical protein